MHFSIAKKYKTRIGQIAVFGLLYFVANLISFIFPDAETALMVIWPAGGIGFCAFLLTPKRFWTVLAFALFAIGIAADVFFAHRLLLASMGYMFANIGESIACSWLVLKVSKRFNNFESINEILALLGATFLINALTSCFGAATSYFVKDVSFVESWLSWYISDGLSLLIMGPFLVSWVTIKNVASAFSPRRWIEFIIFVITWVIANIAIFRSVPYENHIALHPYVLIALLLWPAIRLGLRGVTLAFVITFLI